jgi:hypothetical protein
MSHAPLYMLGSAFLGSVLVNVVDWLVTRREMLHRTPSGAFGIIRGLLTAATVVAVVGVLAGWTSPIAFLYFLFASGFIWQAEAVWSRHARPCAEC